MIFRRQRRRSCHELTNMCQERQLYQRSSDAKGRRAREPVHLNDLLRRLVAYFLWMCWVLHWVCKWSRTNCRHFNLMPALRLLSDHHDHSKSRGCCCNERIEGASNRLWLQRPESHRHQSIFSSSQLKRESFSLHWPFSSVQGLSTKFQLYPFTIASLNSSQELL